ncbi:hypothetical protein [Pseudomonas pergaminensis]|uniref:hypothetical protein n=1 Tax=Pseudomonas pergaminensis TaxID=2853159 RepID=UPI0034D44A94
MGWEKLIVMNMNVIERFVQQELDAHVRGVLQGAIDEKRSSENVYKREFEFNSFDVVLDFSRARVIVQDVLIAGEDGDQEISMSDFIDVCNLKG